MEGLGFEGSGSRMHEAFFPCVMTVGEKSCYLGRERDRDRAKERERGRTRERLLRSMRIHQPVSQVPFLLKTESI